jgi:hypothetical protein
MSIYVGVKSGKLVNMLPAIDGTTGYSGALANASYKKYATNSSLYLNLSSNLTEKTATSTASYTLIPSHKYYARVEVYAITAANDTVDFYWPIAEPPMFGGLKISERQKWVMVSGISDRSSFAAGDYPIRLDYNKSSGVTRQACFDGVMLIDLTAAFGAGNEPTKEWCDENINYFTGEGRLVDNPFGESVNRKIYRSYAGINNVARKIAKGYMGVGGVARKVFQGTKKAPQYFIHGDSKTIEPGYTLASYVTTDYWYYWDNASWYGRRWDIKNGVSNGAFLEWKNYDISMWNKLTAYVYTYSGDTCWISIEDSFGNVAKTYSSENDFLSITLASSGLKDLSRVTIRLHKDSTGGTASFHHITMT